MRQATLDKFRFVALASMTSGYIWLWCFNRNPHVLLKFLTMQAYFLTWLYFLFALMRRSSILGYSMDNLFELNLVLQFVATPAYWLVIHGFMMTHLNLPLYEVAWNIYIHVAPLLLLLIQYFIARPYLKNNWKHTLIFYIFLAIPLNYYYTINHGPVYFFITYRSKMDIIIVAVGAFLLLGIHLLINLVLKPFQRQTKIN